MNRATAPRYDLFKLIVALILLVILILILLRGSGTSSASPPPTELESMTEPTQEDVSPVSTEASLATSAAEKITPSLEPSPTATMAVTATPKLDSATSTAEPVKATAEVAATAPSTTKATPIATGIDNPSCRTSVPSRLSVGQRARVIQRHNVRNAANILAPVLQTNRVGTEVEIIGGPVCQQVGKRAYLWWQIRLASGVEGWSAESPLIEATYLVEPIP